MRLECECGNFATRLRISGGYLGCDECLPPPMPKNPSVISHTRGENKVNRKMSHAEIQHIRTRKIRPDGMIRPDKRWDTKEYD